MVGYKAKVTKKLTPNVSSNNNFIPFIKLKFNALINTGAARVSLSRHDYLSRASSKLSFHSEKIHSL